MKKMLLATVCAVMLAGCTAPVTHPVDQREAVAPVEDNAVRIAEFLEEKMMPDSTDVACAFEQWAQPAGNIVEGWALCQDGAGAEASSGAKLWFANPSQLILPADGDQFTTSVHKNFTKPSARRIFKNEFDRDALEAAVATRREALSRPTADVQGVGGEQ